MDDAVWAGDPSFQVARNELIIQSTPPQSAINVTESCSQQSATRAIREKDEEIESLRNQLFVLQAQHEIFRKLRSVETPVNSQMLQNRDINTHSHVDCARSSSPSDSHVSRDSFATPLSGTQMLEAPPKNFSVGTEIDAKPLYSSVISAASTPVSIDTSRLPKPKPYAFPHITASSIENNILSSNYGRAPVENMRDTAYAGVSQNKTRDPKLNEKRLKSPKDAEMLMKAARKPGNLKALNAVKWELRKAHAVAKDHRTPADNRLIAEWRTAEWDDGSHALREVVLKTAMPISPVTDAPIEEWVKFYGAMSTHQFPPSVRRDEQGLPLRSDVKALRTVARLRPEKTIPNSPNTGYFKPVVVRLFSVHGAYHESILRQGLHVASPAKYTPYVGSLADGVTGDDIACHFAACGVTVEDAENDLGPWARNSIYLRPEFQQG